MKKVWLTALMAGAVVFLAGCSDDAGEARVTDAESLLALVPAETPYLFANLEPLPDELIARYWNDEQLEFSRDLLRGMVAQAGQTESPELAEAAESLEVLKKVGRRIDVDVRAIGEGIRIDEYIRF